MKRIAPLVLGIFILLFAGLLIGPSFVDWNKYKPQIIEQAREVAGYTIQIDGDIGLSLLPLPSLKIEGLRVAAPRGTEEWLLNMKRADVSIGLLPLLGGDIVVDTVRFVNPDIRLEMLADGRNSWMSDKLLADAENAQVTAGNDTSSPSSDTAGSGQNVVLNRLEITEGRVQYSDRRSGAAQLAEDISMSLRADSLQGPFDVKGSLMYGGKTIGVEAKTRKVEGANGGMPVDATISLPDSNAQAKFGGVVALEPALEIQGQMDVRADNLGEVMTIFSGAPASPALSQKLAFSGLVTANENALASREMTVEFGKTKGQGNLQVMNLKDRNPVQILADLGFEGTINLDQVTRTSQPSQRSVEERVARGEKLETTPGFIPETLSLPFPIDADVSMTADGVQTGGKQFKGVTAQLLKKGATFELTTNIRELPGRSAAQAKISGRFGSSSHSGEQGVTYADPTVTFTASGSSEQLPTMLRAFAPEQASNPALEIWRTAEFDLAGTIRPHNIAVRDSRVKLDDTTLGLSGSYAPQGAGGRPDVSIDVTSDTLNIDQILTRMDSNRKQSVQQRQAAQPLDMKKALEPVRAVNVPVNLTFDVSAQRAVFDGENITGIRLKGRAAGAQVNLETASVQNFRGAAASLRGGVANLETLEGVDLSFYGKSDNVRALMQSFQMDTSKLPAEIGTAEANVTAKGKADNLAFDARIKALRGELEAAGTMTGLLGKPAFSNLKIGAKHPNLAQAIQIMNPEFKGGEGLARPFDFQTNAAQDGNSYSLNGFRANLGPTALSGSLKLVTGDKPSLSGAIEAGNLPLDSLLGAKTGSGSSGSSGASRTSGGEKWSRTPVETDWMHAANVDLDLKAQSITYGGWNLVQPSTKINLKDGTLNVTDMKAGLFGGQTSLSARVVDPADARQPLSIAVQSKMNDVALEQLARAMSGATLLRATGTVNLDMDVQTAGLSSHDLVSALRGKANLNGTDVILKGFDLAQLALAFVDTGKPMDRLNSIVSGAVSGGETRFDRVTGAYDIQNGVVTITNMLLDGPSASIRPTGNVNIPQWTIDTVHQVVLKQAREDGSFDVTIRGSLDNPGNTFGRGLFNDVITRRAQDAVIEKLPDLLGDRATGTLQQLGILPGARQPQQEVPAQPQTPEPAAPSPQQAPEQDAPATATPQEPAQQPQQNQSLEEQIRDNPEKALEGVLRGLIR